MKTDTISISQINYKAIFYKLSYYFIVGVLLFSGIAKIIDPLPLIETMRSLNLLPENLVVLLSTMLPIIEIVIGGMMVLKLNEKPALVAATVLFSLFLAVSIYGYIMGD